VAEQSFGVGDLVAVGQRVVTAGQVVEVACAVFRLLIELHVLDRPAKEQQ